MTEIIRISEHIWHVPSNTQAGTYYRVTLDPGRELMCACPRARFDRNHRITDRDPCSHLRRLVDELRVKAP